ncbi:hypothetical protein BJX63DRAFT_429691 [Aspergillus granulosus]|uniref:GPI anchored protein n=1 Tax=Aspergillus granulosus TaxID=176169 RepID=A0ABR4HSJ2_9EURO
MHRSTLHPIIFSLLTAIPYATPQPCPSPSTFATILWPDDLYASWEITVSAIGTTSSITTYTGISCANNPHSMTIITGPSTFWYVRGGGGPDHTLIDDCVPVGDSMDCTLIEQGGMEATISTVFPADEIYTVTVAVVGSGRGGETTPTPGPDSSEDSNEDGDDSGDADGGSTDGAAVFAAQPTWLVVGGLVGLGIALL